MKRSQLFAVAATVALAGSIGAQGTPPATASPAPEVGTMAPDFSVPASREGALLPKGIRLSELRGQTVVIAFFPAARTRG
jgi:peroxiredoxin Q/BCP